MTITEGALDCTVDSLSRITAFLAAADNRLGSFNLDTRSRCESGRSTRPNAKKVAAIYNTRGDKVNDSTAKYAHSETKDQEVARRFSQRHSTSARDNIEVLSNARRSDWTTWLGFPSRRARTHGRNRPRPAADDRPRPVW